MGAKAHPGRRLWQTLASVKTGIILLIVVAVVSAAGTFILQRPLTDPDQLQQAYSPQTLRWLDLLGLTDVFHAWWFALLLALVGVSIVLVSVDRFPKAWRLLTRPYLRAEAHFRAVLPVQQQIPIANAEQAVEAAARVLRKHGLYARRVAEESGATSLFAERNRWSVLSVYVVHLSLLLILAGGIIDAFFGYKGYLSLTPGQQTDKLEVRDKTIRPLPFTLRCDGTGQENYPDGTPKKWWSRLTVLENGREVLRKEIVVNDPLVRDGIRFYQSGYGITGEVESLLFTVTPAGNPQDATQVTLRPNAPATLKDGSTIRLVKFVPDFALQDNQIYSKSNYPDNPAIQIAVLGADGKTSMAWLFPRMGQRQGEIPYDLTLNDLQMQAYTGLQVSHEPGQWAVWGGCLLMALGLVMAFYLVHQRYWVAVVQDKSGAAVLWLGTTADKNRDHLQEEFNEMAEEIRSQVAAAPKARAARREASLVGA